ncbi:hypothetical protein MT418_006887 [Batrachochytrium dendrobatidis]
MNVQLAAELDAFDDYVNNFTSQMNEILNGKLSADMTDVSSDPIGHSNKPDVDSEPCATKSTLSIPDDAMQPIVWDKNSSNTPGPDISNDIALACETSNPVQDAVHKINKSIDQINLGNTKNSLNITSKPSNTIDYSKWENIDVDTDVTCSTSLNQAGDKTSFKKLESNKDAKNHTQKTAPLSNLVSASKSATSDCSNQSVLPRHIQVVHDAVNRSRQMGNAAFKKGDYEQAISHYSVAIETSLSPSKDLLDTQTDSQVASNDPFSFLDRILKPVPILVNTSLYTNRAFAFLKLCKWAEAEADCCLALNVDPTNTKGLWRRIEARWRLGQSELAIKDAHTLRQIILDGSHTRTDISEKDIDGILNRIQSSSKSNNSSSIKVKCNNEFARLSTQLSAYATCLNSNLPIDEKVKANQIIEIQAQFATVMAMIEEHNEIRFQDGFCDWIGQFIIYDSTHCNEFATLLIPLLIKSCYDCTQNIVLVGGHMRYISSILYNTKDPKLPWMVMELLYMLAADTTVSGQQFSQAGDHAKELGALLLRSLDPKQPEYICGYGLFIAHSILSLPICKCVAILKTWDIQNSLLVSRLCTFSFLSATANSTIKERSDIDSILLAQKCLFQVTLLPNARVALDEHMHTMMDQLSSMLHVLIESTPLLESCIRNIETLLAILHNLVTMQKKVEYDLARFQLLMFDLIDLASRNQGMFVSDVYRILPKLAQKYPVIASRLLDADWKKLDWLAYLTDESKSDDLRANILQSMCIWLQYGNQMDIESRIDRWYNCGGLQVLASILESTQVQLPRLIGNATFCASECARRKSCAERLVDLGVIKSLVYHMDHTNDTAILKNIAICCALLSKTEKGLTIARSHRIIERIRALDITA